MVRGVLAVVRGALEVLATERGVVENFEFGPLAVISSKALGCLGFAEPLGPSRNGLYLGV